MSWLSQRLDAVCEVIMGQAPSGDAYNDVRDGWPLVAGAGDFGPVFPAVKKYTREGAKISKVGDIILGVRASIGEKVLSDSEYCLGRGVAALRPSDKLDQRFLWHWIDHVKVKLVAKAKGATFKQVNREDIAEMELVLPPLTEQRRIAAILDQADALRTKRRQALTELNTLTQSIFLEMFGDPATNPKSWPRAELQSVVRKDTIVTYGIVQAGEEYPDGVPYIRTGDIVDGKIESDGLRHTDPAIAAKFERSRVRTGDIVMSIRATVGTTAVVPDSLDGANLTQGTAKIAPGDAVDGGYLLHFLRSEGTQRWISRQIKGATFLEITLTRLRELPVLLPPLPVQREFAKAMAVLESVEERGGTALRTNVDLCNALQQAAFRGEL